MDLKPTTRALYESVIGTHIKPRWSRTAIGKVEHGAVQAWVAELAASGGISAGHVRKIAGVLASVLGLAMRDRRLASNPATGLSLPRIRERPRRYLRAEEVERLADSAGPLGRVIVLTVAYCGLGWSELAALRVERIDLLRRRLTVAEAMTEIDGGRIVWLPSPTRRGRCQSLAS